MNEHEKKEEDSAIARNLVQSHANEFKRMMEQNFQCAQNMVKQFNQSQVYFFAAFAFNPITKKAEVNGTLPPEELINKVEAICRELRQGMRDKFNQQKSINIHGETQEITKPKFE